MVTANQLPNLFQCWHQSWKCKASLTLDQPPHSPCLPQIACAIQKLLFWTWKNLHEHHTTSSKFLSQFSKFDTKFNVDSSLTHHFAIELLSPQKLTQISHNNFFQQVINHIHLLLCKSENNCDVVSKQLVNREHMLPHTVKVLIPND